MSDAQEWPELLILSFDGRAFSFVTDSEREQALKHNDPAHIETYVPKSRASAPDRETRLSEVLDGIEAENFRQFREALLSEEALEAAVRAAFVPPISDWRPDWRRADMRAAFTRALDAIDPEKKA